LKQELHRLKVEQTHEREQLNIQYSQQCLTKEQLSQAVIAISEKYSNKIDEITQVLYSLGVDTR
jgi:hypothetical protein